MKYERQGRGGGRTSCAEFEGTKKRKTIENLSRN